MEDELDVDVVVVGGGVAGCWIGKTLAEAGYATAIVTVGGVGGGQTAHSHVYVHRGHLYRKEAVNELRGEGSTLVSDLRLASNLWDQWFAELAGNGAALDAAPTTGLFGFTSEADAADVEHGAWIPFGLKSAPVEVVPALFTGSALTAFRAVDARCLEAGRLISTLLDSTEVPVIDGDTVELLMDDRRVVGVRARGPGSRTAVRGRAAVFAAGAGNRQLLAALPDATPAVRDRSSFMLVVSDPSSAVLEPLSGVFNLSADDGLFLVSRQEPPTATWLLSDGRDPPAAPDWLRYICAQFEAVFPGVWRARPDLQWGYYRAPKAEVVLDEAFNRQVHSHVVLEVAGNVIACWPTKLTLAPLAAKDVLDLVDDLLGSSQHDHPSLERTDIRMAPEAWHSVALRPWPEFFREFTG